MPGDGMQWCPKCGDVAIPVGEPNCRECEPQSVELSYEDLVKAGVIDPTKVTRTALQNAASIASLMLTTEAMICELQEEPAS